jgi:hypothetical protein
MRRKLAFLPVLVLAVAGCTGDQGPKGDKGDAGDRGPPGADGVDGVPGKDGKDGTPGAAASCTVTSNSDGTRTISCTDGTTATVSNGANGAPGTPGTPGAPGTPGTPGTAGSNGTSCTVVDNGDGSKTITCTDNTSVTILDGAPGAASFNLNAEMPSQLEVELLSITIQSPPVVEFVVKDVPAGRGAAGLKVDGSSASNMRFSMNKLVSKLATGPSELVGRDRRAAACWAPGGPRGSIGALSLGVVLVT